MYISLYMYIYIYMLCRWRERERERERDRCYILDTMYCVKHHNSIYDVLNGTYLHCIACILELETAGAL